MAGTITKVAIVTPMSPPKVCAERKCRPSLAIVPVADTNSELSMLVAKRDRPTAHHGSARELRNHSPLVEVPRARRSP